MKSNDLWHLWSPWLKPKKSPWDQILHLGIKKQFIKNSLIIGNGQILTELHYLSQGKIKVISTSSKGKEKPVWYIESGNIFGEVPFLDGKPCYNIFESMEDCIVYTFSRQVFLEEIVPNSTDILQDIILTLAAKTRSLSSQINDISLNSPKLRVCKMLYDLKSKSNDSTLHTSQQEVRGLTRNSSGNVKSHNN